MLLSLVVPKPATKKPNKPDTRMHKIWLDVCANSTQAGSSKSAESRENVGSTIVKVEATAILTYSSLIRATFQLSEVTLAEESDINKDLPPLEISLKIQSMLETSAKMVISEEDGIRVCETVIKKGASWFKPLMEAILCEILNLSELSTSQFLTLEDVVDDGSDAKQEDIMDLEIVQFEIPDFVSNLPERTGSSRKGVKDGKLGDKVYDMFIKLLPRMVDPLIPLEKPARKYPTKGSLQCNPRLMGFVNRIDENKEDVKEGIDDLKKIEDLYDGMRHQLKFYYVYFLIKESGLVKDDGSKIEMKDLTFRQFLLALFYIGKGTGDRLIHHLMDASKHQWTGSSIPSSTASALVPSSSNTATVSKPATSKPTKKRVDEIDPNTLPNAIKSDARVKSSEELKKLKTINDEWSTGFGIVAFKVTDLIHSNEAHVREAFCIDAYGRDYLTNKVRGTYFKDLAEVEDWATDDNKKDEIGFRILYNAYLIFKTSRVRPIYREDVEAVSV